MITPDTLPFLVFGLAIGFIVGLFLIGKVMTRITGKRWL
jgi:hypothetical protein